MYFKKFTYLFLFFIAANVVFAQADKIRIILHRPPPNQMDIGDMWNITLTNTTKEDLKIYLTGTATEEKDGLIVEGKSKVFTIKPGKTSYKYNDFTGAEIKYNNSKYKEIMLRQGNAPEGSYTICVTAYEESGDIAGQESCIIQPVKQMGSITLISPEDGGEITREQPILFSWTPLPGAKDYTLRIVEIKGDQSPEVAMKTNKPVWEKSGIATTTIQVPYIAIDEPGLKIMDKKKKWSWQAISGEVESEVSSFMVRAKTQISAEIDSIKCTGKFGEYTFWMRVCVDYDNSVFTTATIDPIVTTNNCTPSGVTYTISGLTPALPQSINTPTTNTACINFTGIIMTSPPSLVTGIELAATFNWGSTSYPHVTGVFQPLNNCQTCDSCGNGPIWYFGNKAGLDFRNGTPVEATNSAMESVEGCAIMSDNNGNVKFYTNGVNIWDAANEIMPNSRNPNLNGHTSSSSCIIVPYPGDCNRYYVFYTDGAEKIRDGQPYLGLSYSIVDMTLRGGLGDVDPDNKNISLLANSTEKIAAIKNTNGGYWLIAHNFGTNTWDENDGTGKTFYVYEINSSGLNINPVQTINIGRKHRRNPFSIQGKMIFSLDGTRLALAVHGTHGYWSTARFIEVFNFNRSTGEISGPILTLNEPENDFGRPYGLEFSPNGRYLYFILTGEGDNRIIRADLNNLNGEQQGWEGPSLERIHHRGPGNNFLFDLRIGLDNRIYVTRRQAQFLGVINSPNELFPQYDDEGFSLTRNCTQGFPSAILCPTETSIKKCDCENNILQNGNFTDGFSNWVFRSQSGTIQSPPAPYIAVNQPGCCDQNYSNLWGNKVVGMTLSPQSINFQQGKKYKISFCAKWDNNSNPSMGLVRFKFRASNGQFGWTDGTVIGISQDINSTGWTNYTIDEWTAPSNFNTLLITAENNSTQNDGKFVSWGSLDNICITEINGETTSCNCKGGIWEAGVIEFTDNGSNKNARKDLSCDEKYGIIKVGKPVKIDKNFICNPKDCEAKYDYKLIDNTGSVVLSGSNVSMPFDFTPPTTGQFALEITPICGTDTCKPCIVGLELSSKPDCNCNLNAWGPLPYSINGVPQTPAICGQSTINVTGLSSSIQFNPNAATFMCGPKSSTNCGPVFSWSITGPNGFSATGSGPNWGLSGFPSAGNYLLTVTPVCGNVKCNPCRIKISVDDKKDCMFDVKIDSITCGPKDILGNQTYFVWSSVNNLTGVTASLHGIRPNSYISNLSSSVINPGLNNFNFTYSGPQSSPLCFEYRILRLDKNTDTCVYNVCGNLPDCPTGTPCCEIKLDPAYRGDTLCPGQTMKINWKGCTPTGIVSIMLIDVTNNRVHQVIATDVSADEQAYIWTIPSNIQCNPILKWHFYIADSQDRNCYTYGEDFYIRCCDEVKCDCRGSGWRVLQYSTNGGARYNKLKCNDSVTITPTTQLTFNYEYLCPDPNCPVSIDWKFVNSANPGNVLADGNQINGFSLHPASYSTPGNYILTINPSCGDKGCSQCKIYIKVNGEGNTGCNCIGPDLPNIRITPPNSSTPLDVPCNSEIIQRFTNTGVYTISPPPVICQGNQCNVIYTWFINGQIVTDANRESYENYFGYRTFEIERRATCSGMNGLVCSSCKFSMSINFWWPTGGLGGVPLSDIWTKKPDLSPTIFNPNSSLNPDFKWNTTGSAGKQKYFRIIEIIPRKGVTNQSDIEKDLIENYPLFEVKVDTNYLSYPQNITALKLGGIYIWAVYEIGDNNESATVLDVGLFQAGSNNPNLHRNPCADCFQNCNGACFWSGSGACICFERLPTDNK